MAAACSSKIPHPVNVGVMSSVCPSCGLMRPLTPCRPELWRPGMMSGGDRREYLLGERDGGGGCDGAATFVGSSCRCTLYVHTLKMHLQIRYLLFVGAYNIFVGARYITIKSSTIWNDNIFKMNLTL